MKLSDCLRNKRIFYRHRSGHVAAGNFGRILDMGVIQFEFINVEQGAKVSSSVDFGGKRDIESKNTDIHFIRPGASAPSQDTSFMVSRSWYCPDNLAWPEAFLRRTAHNFYLSVSVLPG